MHPDPKVIEDLVRRIVEIAHPLRVILFGSAARGEMKLDSDIDVLVVVPEGTHRRHTAQRIHRHMIGFPLAVDIVVATERDLRTFGENFSLVYYPALREGREIYVANLSWTRYPGSVEPVSEEDYRQAIEITEQVLTWSASSIEEAA